MRNLIEFPRFTRFLIPIMLTAGLTAAIDKARADDPQTLWSCWYNRGMNIACRVAEAPSAPALTAQQADQLGQARGLSLQSMRQGDLPPSVQLIRAQPGALSGRTVLIPLHTEPFDMSFVAQLARAVLCGSRPSCAVVMGEQAHELATDMFAQFADASDPALED